MKADGISSILGVILAFIAWCPVLDGVVVGQLDVTPSGGSTDESPQAAIANHTPEAKLFVSSGNRGDWDLGYGVTPDRPAGLPFRQANGVLMLSSNELCPQSSRGGHEAPGELTASQGNSSNGGIWIAGFTAAGNGAEANRNAAFAFFPFEDGWIGAHVAADGRTVLVAGNLPEGSRFRRLEQGTRTGEITLTLPGIHAVEDGMLFVVAAGNGDNVTATGPLEDGSGWQIRVADESHNFRGEERGPFSVLFVPYHTPGLRGGWIGDDGAVRRGVGEFAVTHADTGRYELFFPGVTAQDGILLLQVCKLNKDGVEDNALAWEYDREACNGRGGFVVESYDQPGFGLQNVSFCALLVPFVSWPGPVNSAPVTRSLGSTWGAAIAQGQAAIAAERDLVFGTRYWASPVMRKGDVPVSVAMPIEGFGRVWLAADTVDGNGGDHAAWGNPRFVLRDGSELSLTDLPMLYHRVGWGKLEKRTVIMGGRTFEHGVFAHAHSLVALNVPPEAVALRTAVGIAESANDKGSVRFRICDTPHRRSVWDDRIRPALKVRFPVVNARFRQDCAGMADPDNPGAWLAAMTSGLKEMRTGLGPLASRLRTPEPELAGVCPVYAAAARLTHRVEEVEDGLWGRLPMLAQVLDYPRWSAERLRSKLLQVGKLSPRDEASAQARLALFDEVAACRKDVVVACLEDREDHAAFGRFQRTAEALLEAEGWADERLGWSTYGGDNRRSGISREVLPAELGRCWTHEPAAPPAPAWPPPRVDNPAVNQRLSPTLTYDRAFHVVVSGDRLFYGSSSEDAVICLSARTGEEQWRFFTGGPVRTTPTVAFGRVYAGSDDGNLYCLDAEHGVEMWRYHAAPEDRRLAGNQRIISETPVRCGICVDQGRIYAGAGVFPSLGTWLFALDAHDGREIWRVPSHCTLQGHMLVSPDRLFVPTGRTPFRMFQRADGAPLGSLGRSNSWGKDLPGGSCAVVVNETIATGPGEGGNVHVFNAQTKEAVVKTPGRRLIVDGHAAYILGKTSLTAVTRSDYLDGQSPVRRWRTPCPSAYTMIKVSNRLILGADDRVLVFNAETGLQVDEIGVPGGRVEGLAFTRGQLYASMGDGQIHCLGPKDSAAAENEEKAESRPTTAGPGEQGPDAMRAAALLDGFGRQRGYILIGGSEWTDVAAALARQSECRIVLRIPNPEVQGVRQRLSAAGLLGTRVAVHGGHGPGLPYRPYLFNLVVAGDSGVSAAEWGRVVAPCGGRIVFAGDGEVAEGGLGTSFAETTVPKHVAGTSAFVRGQLPGGGSWTHGYADPANTACSDDQIPFGPTDVLWFGRPGPRFMLERHIKGTPPLYENGVLYVTGQDYLAGMDAYNGTILWERRDPGSGRMAMLKDCGNMVAADGRLYVAVDDHCMVLDGATGEQTASYPVANFTDTGEHWGYMAAWEDLLIGSATKSEAELEPGNKEDYSTVWYHFKPVVTSLAVFGLQRDSGRVRWSYVPESGVVVNPSITISDGRLLFVESVDSATREDNDGKVPLPDLCAHAKLTALDSRSGRIVWSVPVDLTGFDHALYMAASQGTLVLTGTRHDEVDGKTLIQYRLLGIDATSGQLRWQNDNTPTRAHILDGGHGEQTQHPAIVSKRIYGPGFVRDLLTGESVDAWKWNKSPQCATLSASASCAFSRQGGRPTMASFETGREHALTRVTRPGCWINTLPVGGIVLIPEASSGCTCGYSVQTSLALYPKPR